MGRQGLSTVIGFRDQDGVGRASSLGVPARARVYDAVVAAYPEWVSREDAAAAAGLSRGLAAFHLDRLAEAGLLEVSSRRLSGRAGPGAGRPAKLYRRSRDAVEVSIPPRNYELASELLVRALEVAGQHTALRDVAFAAGRSAAFSDPATALERLGYEPAVEADVIRLRNCPFHALAERHREAVCGMNLALLAGLVEGTGYRAELMPAPDFCCVVLARGGR